MTRDMTTSAIVTVSILRKMNEQEMTKMMIYGMGKDVAQAAVAVKGTTHFISANTSTTPPLKTWKIDSSHTVSLNFPYNPTMSNKYTCSHLICCLWQHTFIVRAVKIKLGYGNKIERKQHNFHVLRGGEVLAEIRWVLPFTATATWTTSFPISKSSSSSSSLAHSSSSVY